MKKNKKKMLVTGVSGQLGSNLAYFFKDHYDVLGLYCSHEVRIEGVQTEKGDILASGPLKGRIRAFHPDILIHCASLTNIDFCESHKDLTEKINVLGTKSVADSIRDLDCKLIYISTDSVYDGINGSFKESDAVCPQNFYGLTKYTGEQEVLKVVNSLVVRTNIFGWNIQNKYSIAEWILHELMENREIVGFKDVYFSSIYNLNFAKILELIVERDLSGIYNCGSSTSSSKFEFALHIADCFNLDKKLIKPISIDDSPFIAKRGKNLTLNINKLKHDLNFSIPTIRESVEHFYNDYRRGLPETLKRKGRAYPILQTMLPYGRQLIDEDDIEAVVHVLKSPYLTQGPKVAEFETDVCHAVDAEFGAACNSGTSALHMACLAAGVSPGDEVITSPNTFVASANCVLYCGAKPVFADIDSKTYNISPEQIERRITKQTKAIIPVHFAGQSCDMEAIRDVVTEAEKKYGHKIYIIEDACHALGSIYKSRKVGSCAFSDMTVMSFHPVKHITTGEGGMVLTNDDDIIKRIRRLRSHGLTSDPGEFLNKDLAYQGKEADDPSPNPWYYEQVSLGFNYRITDIQCALGISQLKKLGRFVKRRREIVDIYNEAFANKQFIQIPYEDKKGVSNFHLYVLLFDFAAMKMSRAQMILELRQRGIQTQVHYVPVHLQSYYRKHFRTGWGDCPRAEAYYQRCLSLPLHPSMVDQDVNRVAREVNKLVEGV
jgi:UDP-4-amino-4,6-dideoxy-N-acetyl-beta-L-altrosamine transaminase/dTDP-4-dehydrorhamnose reductase